MVSIIIPLHNGEQFIAQTIESVQVQTYSDWEMIIVDDCSTDKSIEVVKNYMKKENRIQLIMLEQNSGPAIARNRAIQEAKGRYIAFLDSDDMWHKDKLLKQLEFMQSYNSVLSFTGYYRVEEDTEEIINRVSIPPSVDYNTLLKQNIMGCLTVIYDTERLGKVYMPNLLRRQDFALWLKILKEIPYADGLNEPLAYYRVRTESISSNKLRASLYNWKLYREVEKLPLYKAVYYFGWYTYKSILKYKK